MRASVRADSQRRFARAGWADDRHEFTLLDGNVDSTKRLHGIVAGVVGLRHSLELDEGLCGHRFDEFC